MIEKKTGTRTML